MKNIKTDLINTLVQVIVQNPNLDINKVRPTRKMDPNNIWNIICLKLFNNISYAEANKIFKIWHNKTSKLAEQVLSLCGSIENGDKNGGNGSNPISLAISAVDWVILSTYIVNSPRRRFTSQFTDFLSEKLQENGIKCWLRCSYNWFKKSDSQKSSSPFWQGVYKCTDPSCSNTFSAFIHSIIQYESSNCVIIFVDVNEGNTKHKNIVLKKIRCIRDERLAQAKEIALDTSLNCHAKNILHNKIQTKQNSK